MKPGILAAKLVRRFTRHSNYGKRLLRNHLRKWFIDEELPSSTRGGFMMYASPNNYASYNIFFYGVYDPYMTSFFQGQVFEGAHCWDIGTERGWFTLLMARLAGPSGRVEAFEPFPDNFRRLQANVGLNSYVQVHTHQLALSDTVGEQTFVLPEDGLSVQADFLEGCTGVGYLTDTVQSGVNTINVATSTIDNHMQQQGLTRLDFMKIDVEGAEIAVLRGGAETIKRCQPVIVIEYNELTQQRAGYTTADLDALVESYGYERFVFDGRLRRYHPQEWQSRPLEEQVYNVYCLPGNEN